MLSLPRFGDLDPSARSLILANIITAALAILFGFDLSMVVWVYFAESVIIGLFVVATLLVMGFRIYGKQTGFAITLVLFVGFFIVHYGMFHFGYLVFLMALPWFSPSMETVPYLALTSGAFLLSHGYSFYVNVLKDKEIPEGGKDWMGKVFTDPYGRIVPMHLAILFSGFIVVFLPVYAANLAILLFFMGLKTVGDLYAHQRKHHHV
jgi:hypothetical protein